MGIGTTTPEATLHVIHHTFNTTPVKPAGNWAAIIENNQDGSDSRNGLAVVTRWGSEASKVFEAGSYWNGSSENYTPILTVSGNRNVGIGTTTPSWKLHVNGEAVPSLLLQQNGNHSHGIVSGLETFNNGSGTQDGPRLGFHKHGAKAWSAGIQPGTSNGFAIYEDGYELAWGTERLTIAPGGEVTIHNALRSKINVRGTWGGWNWWTGCNQHDYWMIPVNEGNCFLTGILGDMRGGGEGGYIREESGWYVLRLQSCRGANTVYVTATCIGR